METWRHELYHHGIMGMKWGVRRYQNKDGTLTAEGKKRIQESSKEYASEVSDDIVFKKGQNFDRVGSKNETDTGSTFVSYTEKDRNTYRANVEALPIYEQAYKIKLEAIKDLKVAGAKAQTEILLDYLGDKPFADIYADEITKGYSKSDNYKLMRKRELARQRKRYKEVLLGKGDYADIFDDAFSRYVDRESDITTYMKRRLQEKGYSAAVDLWDTRGFAEKPIYVFDRSDSLKTISKSELSQKEIDDAVESFIHY